MSVQIEDGGRYNGVVVRAQSTESKSGKPGISVHVDVGADHPVSKTIWLTDKSLDIAEKQLRAMGATTEQLCSADWIEYPTTLVGAEVSVTVEEREYRGETTIEIKWINSRHRTASAESRKRAAALFSGTEPSTPIEPPKISDDDIPF